MTKPGTDPDLDAQDAPLLEFSMCHVGILTHLNALAGLPALLGPAARARQIAADMLGFFRGSVFEHHLEEEKDLFPAVIESAAKGEERDRVKVMVDQLTAEHRVIEAAWARLEPDLKKVAKGQDNELNIAGVEHLVRSYREHAGFEERQFLPMAHMILSRNSNHMAALGLSLHLRHTPLPVGHI